MYKLYELIYVYKNKRWVVEVQKSLTEELDVGALWCKDYIGPFKKEKEKYNY